MHVRWCEADGKTARTTLESSSFGNLIRRELLYRLKSKITPLCKGQATEERHISSQGGRGGNPKSEF